MNVHKEVTTLRNTFVFKNSYYDHRVGGHASVLHKSLSGTPCTRTAWRKGLVQAVEINPKILAHTTKVVTQRLTKLFFQGKQNVSMSI